MVIPQLAGSTREVITPHKVAVVVLILEYYKKDADIVWLPKYLKKFGLLLLRLIQNADLSYRDLYNLLTSYAFCLHPAHLAAFEASMEQLVSSDKEMLYAFYQSLEKFIMSVEVNSKAAPINESSIVFLYLRRFIIAMHRLSLLEEVSLYHAICEYYRKGVRAITLAADDLAATTTAMAVDFAEANQQAMDEGRDFRRWNRKQIELFVGQQFNKLEYNEAEALPPRVLQATIDEIIEDNPRYSPAYFLDYLNSLRCGDLFNCLEKLHRCFDVNEQRPLSQKPGKGYQYFVLNLAMLHARFGHAQLALSCLREAIMLAQEVGDRECIELAENWRQFLGNSKSAAIKGGGGDNLPTIFQSMNNQLVAKACAIQGATARRALQIVSETGFVNHSNSLLVASGVALKSAIFNQMGKHYVAALNAQLLLNCPLKTYGNTVNGEAQCKSLLGVAGWLSAQGDCDQAAVLLQLAADTHQSGPLRGVVAKAELQVALDRYLMRRQWERAAAVCEQMDTYDGVEKGIALARLNVERGNFPTATAIVEKLLLLWPDRELTAMQRTQLNLLKMHIMLGIREPNCEVMNLAVNTWNFAKAHNLSYEVARVEVVISKVQLLLDMPAMAKRCIERAMIKVLTDGSLADQGEALWQYLKCLLLVVPREQPQAVADLLTTDRGQLLDGIVEIFSKLECTDKLKQIYQFVAELCHSFGLREERNQFAFKYKQLVVDNRSVIGC